jgi:hypothetical protein
MKELCGLSVGRLQERSVKVQTVIREKLFQFLHSYSDFWLSKKALKWTKNNKKGKMGLFF